MDMNAVRSRLSREFGIRLAPMDPVLDVAAICEVALENALQKIEGAARSAADQMSVAAAQNREAIKQSAEQVVKAAAEWCAADMKRAAIAAADEIACRLREPVERAEKAAKLAVQAAWIAGCSASFVVLWIVGRTIGYAIPLTWKFW